MQQGANVATESKNKIDNAEISEMYKALQAYLTVLKAFKMSRRVTERLYCTAEHKNITLLFFSNAEGHGASALHLAVHLANHGFSHPLWSLLGSLKHSHPYI